MLNYIKSEWFRTFHRKYLYITLGCLSAVIIATAIILRINETDLLDVTGSLGTFLLSVVISVMSAGYYLTLLIADMIFTDEYKHQTLKNTVSYGTSRVKIYMGKLISSMMAGMLVLAVIIAVTIAASLLILGMDAQFTEVLTQTMLPKILAFLPLWMAGVAMGIMLLFFFKNTAASFAFLGIAFVLPMVLNYLRALYPVFGTIRDLMVVSKLNLVSSSNMVTGSLMADCWITGLAAVLIYTLIGALVFSRKEIK